MKTSYKRDHFFGQIKKKSLILIFEVYYKTTNLCIYTKFKNTEIYKLYIIIKEYIC